MAVVKAELVGSEHRTKSSSVSGHIDCWDVGQGAMDGGGAAFAAWRRPCVQ